MLRTMKLGALSVAMLAATAGPIDASPMQAFDFSFTGPIHNGYGDYLGQGTVTGEVVLDFTGYGTGAATNVYIDSLPPGFTSLGALPYDLLATVNPDVIYNTFTITPQGISYDFQAYTNLYFRSPYQPTFWFDIDNEPTGNGGYAADDLPPPLDNYYGNRLLATDTATLGPVPEPATLPVLGTGFLAFGFGCWRKRQAA